MTRKKKELGAPIEELGAPIEEQPAPLAPSVPRLLPCNRVAEGKQLERVPP